MEINLVFYLKMEELKMFKFITKKYEDRIKSLERQIEYMTWKWNKEKTHYSEIKEDLI